MTALRTYTNQELLDHIQNMAHSGNGWQVSNDLLTVLAGRLEELMEYKDINEAADTYDNLREMLNRTESLQSGVNKALVMVPGSEPYFVLGACSQVELRELAYSLKAPRHATVIFWRQDFITGKEVELALSLRPAIASYSWTIMGEVKTFEALGEVAEPEVPAEPVRRMRMRKPATPNATPPARVRVRRPA
ncbi:hypothetical protein H10PHJ05_18 [Aeromonas phage HJ05]|nr:hypothetical protein H10PHJ05_18 [Aeromonas phage HJ05]